MNKKLSKALFHLTSNSRITTKSLSKKIRSSQQSASYLVKQLKNKKIIKWSNAIIDPIKLGFSNIIVGINYKKFDSQTKKEVLSVLKNNPHIINIQEASQGVDLLVEYCVYNLSFFNKTHSEFAHLFYNIIETKFIFPVIVKHKYDKSYLVNRSTTTDFIICGDRETHDFGENDLKVLQELSKNSDSPLTKIAKKINLSVKTVISIKKRLEKLKIIRGYDCVLDHKKVSINRSIILLQLSGLGIGEVEQLVQVAKTHKNVVEIIKTIGDYQVALVVESLSQTNLLTEIRSKFSIEDYWIIEIDNITKEQYLPSNFNE